MPKIIDVTRLSPMRRGFLAGYRRAKVRARAEMHALATDFDTALAGLERDFHELAVAHCKQCHDAAVSEALLQRAIDPDALLH